MHERTQFIWGASTLTLWLITTLIIYVNKDTASSISFPYLHRHTPQGEGWKAWKDAEAASTPVTQAKMLASAGCNASIGLWAPICTCLSDAYTSTGLLAITSSSSSPPPASTSTTTTTPPPAIACASKKATAQVVSCFMTARQVQKITVRDTTLNPYLILLMVNAWSAVAGVVLLVRGKLADQNSPMLQIVLQILVFIVAFGTMGLVFKVGLLEWIVLGVVSFLLAITGWEVADEDPAAWYINQFHLLFAAGCPTMMVLFNAYTHRLDVIYFASTVLMALVLGLTAAMRMQLERLDSRDPCTRYWDPATWARIIISLLTTCLIIQTYDEGDRGPTLKSAFYSWVGIAIYFALAMHSIHSISQALYTDVLIRAVVTAAMLNELFNV